MVCFRKNVLLKNISICNTDQTFYNSQENRNSKMKVYALKKIRFIHSNKQIPEDEDAYNQPEIRSIDIESTKLDQINNQKRVY